MSIVAKFNTHADHTGASLASVLREYPDATIRVVAGWIEFHSDNLPISHPINVLSDVVQVAWEAGAITDARFSEASAAVETLRDQL